MTIERDGKTYELTKEEMYQAYYTVQREFDVEDVRCSVEYLDLPDFDVAFIQENNEFADCIAMNFRSYLDNYDDFDIRLDALRDAYDEAKSMYEEKGVYV